MEIEVLAEFQLKMTKIGYDIAKNQMFPQVWYISFYVVEFGKTIIKIKT